MNYRSLFNSRILPNVRKPNRYAGLELNRIHKENPLVRWVLAFPDLYEIGMSHLGLAILYHRINSAVPEVAAERCFIPDIDAAALLRKEGIPLLSLESGTPLSKADAIGISLGYEMVMPGLLELLDLGQVPFRARDRREDDPIVIAGGPVVYNPEPVADFLDVVAVGDGENMAVRIAETLLQAKKNGSSRSETLDSLGKIKGIYLPNRYRLVELNNNGMVSLVPADENMPEVIQADTVDRLAPEFYPASPLVPMTEIVHDRINLEIMRGCTRGCRFCNAGMIYRPVRERSVEDVISQAVENIAATGYEEIGLTSLSTSDYSALPELISGLREEFNDKRVSLSFPSLRPDSFTLEMAKSLPGGRKGGLTFAPEAGTQRLRNVINKNSNEKDLLRASKLAYEQGWNGVKLYFMTGLPTETIKDLDGIVDLVAKVARLRVRKSQKITVSVSPFVPKAHTPYQWYGQDSPEKLKEKLNYLRQKFKGSPVRFTGHNPENTLFEGALARGDRRLGAVIENVWRMGGILEAWNDKFDPERWSEAFRAEGISPGDYVRKREPGETLPWSHISKGIDEKFLKREWKGSLEEELLEDCRLGKCHACGLTAYIPQGSKVCNLYYKVTPVSDTELEKIPPDKVVCMARLKYRRGDAARWTGHLDLIRVWNRLVRRANIPVAYSQGFHPHPRLSFGPPLPVGIVSEDEYIDMELSGLLQAAELLEMMKSEAPEGIEPQELCVFKDAPESLSATVDCIDYGFRLPSDESEKDACSSVIESMMEWMRKDHYIVKRSKRGKRRDVDIRPFVSAVTRSEDDRWRVRLYLDNGATARLGELESAWGYPGQFIDKVRLNLFIRNDDRIISPMAAAVEKQEPVSMAGLQ